MTLSLARDCQLYFRASGRNLITHRAVVYICYSKLMCSCVNPVPNTRNDLLLENVRAGETKRGMIIKKNPRKGGEGSTQQDVSEMPEVSLFVCCVLG
jgi:hypothetical protein